MNLQSVTQLINQYLPEPHAGLLAGILFGVRATMERDLYNDLIATGTLHMVALSGANISILVSLVNSALLELFRFSNRIVGLLTVCIIIGFISFVGPSPSVVRAALMGGIAALGIVTGRQVWSLWSWFVAVCIMLAFMPSIIGDVSFQLSAGATLGIILFGTRTDRGKLVRGKWKTVNAAYRCIEEDLRTTLSAQVFTVPIILAHFHRISLISPLPNILIAPIIAPLTALGYVMVLSGMLWSPAGQALAWIAWGPLHYVISVIRITANIPLASIGY